MTTIITSLTCALSLNNPTNAEGLVIQHDFNGKLVDIQKHAAGRGAAAGQFMHYKLYFEVTAIDSGEGLSVGKRVPCEIPENPEHYTLTAKEMKIGDIYHIHSFNNHPAHAEGLYLLDCRVDHPVE